MLKISVFTVMIPDLEPADAAKALADYGYDGVEWRVTTVPEERKSEAPSFWGNNLCTFAPTAADAQRAKEVADANGLQIPGLGTYISCGDLEATAAAMKFAQICGAKQVRVHPGSMEDGITYPEKFETAKAFLADVQALAKQTGIRAMVEMHHNTITPSASLAHRLVSNFDAEYIGVLHDCGNMVHEGFEHYRMGLELLGPYLYHVHIKNGKYERPEGGGVWKSTWASLEDGVVDWSALFGALASVSYDGWLGLEDFSGTYNTHDALKNDIAFLKDQIEKAY